EVAQPVEQPVHGHHQRALPATLQTALRLAEPGAELVEGAVPIERRHHVRRDLVEFVPDSGSDQGSKFCARSVAPGGGDAAGGAGSGGHAAALVPAGPWPAAFPSVPPGAGIFASSATRSGRTGAWKARSRRRPTSKATGPRSVKATLVPSGARSR